MACLAWENLAWDESAWEAIGFRIGMAPLIRLVLACTHETESMYEAG